MKVLVKQVFLSVKLTVGNSWDCLPTKLSFSWWQKPNSRKTCPSEGRMITACNVIVVWTAVTFHSIENKEASMALNTVLTENADDLMRWEPAAVK